jgi:DNA-binding PadR family transcriptional regulator
MASVNGPGALAGELRRSGLVALLVLHYVSIEPCYGNQLIARIGRLTGGAISVNPNTMYPLLRSLETRGLVSGRWEDPARRTRRFYRITASGESERCRLMGELAPNLDAIASTIDALRAELLEH